MKTLTTRHGIGCAVALVALLAVCDDARSQGPVRRDTKIFRIGSLTTQPPFGDRVDGYVPVLRGWDHDSYDTGEVAFDDEETAPEGMALSWIDDDALGSVIESLIAEDSWSNARNGLDIVGDHLVVTQTPGVLAQVGAFVADLEARLARLLRVDVAMVPLAALDAVRTDWRGAYWLDADVVDAALAAAGDDGWLLSGLAHAGVPRQLQVADAARHIVDFEVNQTGVLPAANPVIDNEPDGLFASVRVHRAATLLRVDLEVDRTDALGVRERRGTPTGAFELTDRRDTALRTSLLVPPGRSAVVGFLDLAVGGVPGDDARAPSRLAVVLRVREASRDVRSDERAHPIRTVDAAALTASLPHFRFPRDFEFPRVHWGGTEFDDSAPIDLGEDLAPDTGSPRLVGEAELEAAFGAVWPRSRSAARVEELGGVWFTSYDDAAVERARVVVETLLRERARVLGVDVRQVSVARDELARIGGIGAVLEPDAAKSIAGEPCFELSVAGFAGLSVAIGSSLSRSYVEDIERVSGGNENRIIERTDVVTSRIGGGVVLEVQADLVPGTPWVQLRLEGGVASYPNFERRARARADLTVEPRSDSKQGDAKGDADPPGVRATADWIDIDLPDQRADRIQHLVTMPLGRAMILSALPDHDTPGRLRVLIATVREVPLPWPEPTDETKAE